MPYAWGSDHLIQDLTGLGTVGEPAAELWFGSHSAAPSKVLAGGEGSLADYAPDLGFLVKFLAAAKPLSIQAHPTKERAIEQFAAGNPSYSDANHKPEMIIALTQFEALCGFRELEQIAQDLGALAKADGAFTPWKQAFELGGIQGAALWAFENNLSQNLMDAATVLPSARQELLQFLSKQFPGDVGLLVGTLLLKHVTLSPGQALFLPAGNIHAYLQGMGVEVMASSNNVLRGGLTPKPIDIPELMAVLDFRPMGDALVKTKQVANGLTQYLADVPDFTVYGVEVSGANMLIDLELQGQLVLVCTSGELAVSTSTGEFEKVSRGQAAFVSDARLFSITGSGSGYLAMG